MSRERTASGHPPSMPSSGRLQEDLCDEFEARLQQGQRPQIEEYLARSDSSARADLLSNLLSVEVYWRRRQGESPSADEYCQRFPGQSQQIEHHFSQANMAAPARRAIHTNGQEIPAADRPAVPAAEPPLGRCLGSYELIKELGRGGMGVVYLARQPSADRLVALKIIRRDRLLCLPQEHQTSIIHRFRHEAQAAGRIEHDHIVSVYEVGEIDGEHFFSMRYVEGRSIAEMLKEGPLDGRRAAGYLEPVARAVHEAHQRGILHRDLKPQNLLIDAKTDRALVVDFGLAKLVEQSEQMTEAGAVMGTPTYMSPEQARDASSVTAKSDVYALGATLYHMLVGRPPFHASNGFETMRQVIEQAPIAPHLCGRRIDGDLETICLKCIEKDPAKRYASAEALADDLGHYLRREPIAARPIAPAERFWRWCRRNPSLAASSAAAVLFLVAALLAATIGYVQTSISLTIAQQQRAKADEGFRQLRAAIERFFTKVSEDELMDRPGMQPLRQELLQEAVDSYNRLRRQFPDAPSVDEDLAANCYLNGRLLDLMGDREQALRSLQTAYEIQRELHESQPADIQRLAALGNTINALGCVQQSLGSLKNALDKYHEAIDRREALDRLAPDSVEFKRQLANSYMNAALAEWSLGSVTNAREHFEQATGIRRNLMDRLGQDDLDLIRDLARGLYNAGMFEAESGNLQAAAAKLKEAAERFSVLCKSRSSSPDNKYFLAVSRRGLADIEIQQWCERPTIPSQQQSETGKPGKSLEEALALYASASSELDDLVIHNPAVDEYRHALAGLLINLGRLHVNLARLTAEESESPGKQSERHQQAAYEAFERARGLLEDLIEPVHDHAPVAGDAPGGTPDHRRDLGITYLALAELLQADEDALRKGELLERACKQFESLPNGPEIPYYSAVSYSGLADLAAAQGQWEAALGRYQDAIDCLSDVVDVHKPGQDGRVYVILARAYWSQGQLHRMIWKSGRESGDKHRELARTALEKAHELLPVLEAFGSQDLGEQLRRQIPAALEELDSRNR